MYSIVEAVDYVEEVLADILRSIANKNVSELIQQAENMLTELQNKEFSASNNTCHRELRMAYECEGGMFLKKKIINLRS